VLGGGGGGGVGRRGWEGTSYNRQMYNTGCALANAKRRKHKTLEIKLLVFRN